MVALAVGCAHAGTAKPVDPLAARAELMKVDRDFASALHDRGLDGFAEYVADDAVSLPAGGDVKHGKAAIVEGWSELAAKDGPTLDWQPIDASVSASGDLGYTYGTYTLTYPHTAQGKRVEHGKYTTIWRKQKDGKWRFVLDTGNSSPEPEDQGGDGDGDEKTSTENPY
jgi:uncharacterized protein (TIGR02246 family)